MAHNHQLHRNSNLQRAIRAQAGMTAFPYRRYRPVEYDARYTAYGAYGLEKTADTKTDAGATLAEAIGTIAEVAGGLFGNYMKSKAEENALNAQLEANVAIESARADADAQAAEANARFAALTSAPGGTVGAVAMILGGVVVLGGIGYLTFFRGTK